MVMVCIRRRVHKNAMGAGNPLVSNNGTEYVARVCVVECLSFMHKSMATVAMCASAVRKWCPAFNLQQMRIHHDV